MPEIDIASFFVSFICVMSFIKLLSSNYTLFIRNKLSVFILGVSLCFIKSNLKIFLTVSYILKTSSTNSNPDEAAVMQEMDGVLKFFKPVMDGFS